MTIDWENIRRNKFARDAPPQDWPQGVRPISLGGTNLFGIDHDGALYWDGHKVITRSRLSLTGLQASVAIAAALASVLSGVIALLQYLCRFPWFVDYLCMS